MPVPQVDDKTPDTSLRFHASEHGTTMRIGEIAVVGPKFQFKRQFIESASDEVVVQSEKLVFGRVKINNQLMLHLYGLDYRHNDHNPSWDLVSRKLLGYVVLFDWSDPGTLDSVKELTEKLLERYRIPVVVVAGCQDRHEVPQNLLNIDLSISRDTEFTVCDVRDGESVRKSLVMLIDAVLDRIK